MNWSEYIKKCKTGYPASIPLIVAHIQKYLTENPIPSDNTLEQIITDYLDEHPITITVDNELSNSSENPVQNKVIKQALDNLPTPQITIDDALSATSENPVQNKVIKQALDNIPSITVDAALSTTSENPVQNKVIKQALDNIPSITVDDSLSSTSENPVQNKVIKNALDNLPTPQLETTPLYINVPASGTNIWVNDSDWPTGSLPLGVSDLKCCLSIIEVDSDGVGIVCSENDIFKPSEWSYKKTIAPIWVYVGTNKIYVATKNNLSPTEQISIRGFLIHV